jgi:hypothetical protein
MHRILFLPDIRQAGYPLNPKAGYRISGRILDNYIFGFNSFNNYRLLQTVNKA